MKTQPHLDELIGYVEVCRKEFDEFVSIVKSKNPPEWVPATYRVVDVEMTNQKDENSPTAIAKVTLKYLGQTGV